MALIGHLSDIQVLICHLRTVYHGIYYDIIYNFLQAYILWPIPIVVYLAKDDHTLQTVGFILCMPS